MARSYQIKRYGLLAAMAMGLAACSDVPQNAIYAHHQCTRLTLIDNATGKPVIGAEDMVKLPGGDLLITAYDRRRFDAKGRPKEGGIYRLSATDLSKEKVRVSSLFDTMPGGLRPHGVDAIVRKDGTIHAAFVNRGYSGQQLKAQVVSFDLKGRQVTPPKLGDVHCRANDLVLGLQENKPFMAITADRTHCDGVSSVWENVSGSHGGTIIHEPNTLGITSPNLAFANGIGLQFKDRPLGDNNFLAIAETRANRLRYLPKTERRDTVTLSGSPDNITVGKPGIIIAAVHPSLFKLALYRHGWSPVDRAPSRVLKVTGDEVLTLFDDPTGKVFSAASVGVQTAGRLVLGSVGDQGLLVCRPREVS